MLESMSEMVDNAPALTVSYHLPFSPPYFSTIDPRNVDYILRVKFESFVKGKFVDERLREVLGNLIAIF